MTDQVNTFETILRESYKRKFAICYVSYHFEYQVEIVRTAGLRQVAVGKKANADKRGSFFEVLSKAEKRKL